MKERPHRVVIATGNPGKVREFAQILEGCHLEAVPQSEFGVPDVPETGTTFVENAIIKARNASAHTGLPAIADDSGIEVDALDGRPGIYSARFAGAGASDQANLDKLIEEMRDVPEGERAARYQALIVYLRHAEDPTPIICQGTWEGRLLFEPVGDGGFGYDPIFYVPERGCSSAELTADEKHVLSHRGKALRELVARLGNA